MAPSATTLSNSAFSTSRFSKWNPVAVLIYNLVISSGDEDGNHRLVLVDTFVDVTATYLLIFTFRLY